MSIRKRLVALLAAAVLLCTIGATAFAYDVPDMSKKGCIQITMKQGKTVVPGGNLTLYRVGSVYADNGNYSFQLTGNFKDCGESLKDVQSAALAKKLAQYAAKNKIAGTTKDIGKDGKITFDNLELGLYLMVQDKAANGYNKAEPFLVTVPMLENGKYVYDVNASPKVEVEKEPTKPTTQTNKPTSSTLPKTGQLDWPIPILVVSGLGLFSIGWMLRFGNKKGKYEK
ncbi:MAG: pilin N-terminal domain-containing protein [Eubacteriales bacterium]|nr:pilin N-terminal domain-containing protein [Eubacteriales bacterium]